MYLKILSLGRNYGNDDVLLSSTFSTNVLKVLEYVFNAQNILTHNVKNQEDISHNSNLL